jgi:hypothetical protein
VCGASCCTVSPLPKDERRDASSRGTVAASGVNVERPTACPIAEPPIRLGLRENLGKFALLVAVSRLVGGMIGQ